MQRAAAYALAAPLGGLAVGTAAWSIGAVTWRPSPAVVAAVGLASVVLVVLRGHLPSSSWRIPVAWTRFGPVRYAGAFGFILGLGLLTAVPGAAFYALLAWAASAESWTSVASASIAFGLARGLTVVGVAISSSLQARDAWERSTVYDRRLLTRMPRRLRSSSAFRPRCSPDRRAQRLRRTRGAFGACASVSGLLAVALSCAGNGERNERTEPPRPGTAFVLLADNRLVKIDLATGAVLAKEVLARAPRSHSAGRYLAFNGRVFVLARGNVPVLAEIDIETARPQRRHALDRRLEYWALAAGTRSRRLYVFATRAGTRVGEFGRERSAVVAVFAPDGTTTFKTRTLHGFDGREWVPYAGTVSPDERYLAVTYHGADTSGADLFTLPEVAPARCRAPPPPGSGCVQRAHGAAAFYGRRLLYATGGPALESAAFGGTATHRWMTDLGEQHIMEFALDARRELANVAGACGYGTGIVEADLDRTTVRALGDASAGGRSNVCATRIALADNDHVVVAITERPVPNPARRGAIALVSRATGRIVRTVNTEAEPVDVLVLPLRGHP